MSPATSKSLRVRSEHSYLVPSVSLSHASSAIPLRSSGIPHISGLGSCKAEVKGTVVVSQNEQVTKVIHESVPHLVGFVIEY